MRIGCLQFAPQVGDVDNNLNRADVVLESADCDRLDLLVLPELAFSGYNFKSLTDISPFLEFSELGISSLWARTIALKYDCTVVVGYPEKVDVSSRWPADPEYYNAALVVSGDGEHVANYRKSHLFMTDETWALENPHGFYDGWLDGLGQTVIGICMDLNPYRFEAPWDAFEFAFHVIEAQADLVILSMAWLTREDEQEFRQTPQEPDMDTLMYWVTRLEPLIRNESGNEIIVVFANRSGAESDVVYAGTSAVLGIKDGEVRVYGVLGRGDKELLVVDTEDPPYARLVYQPENQAPQSARLASQATESPAASQREDISGKSQRSAPTESFSSSRQHSSGRQSKPSQASGNRSTEHDAAIRPVSNSGRTSSQSSAKESAYNSPPRKQQPRRQQDRTAHTKQPPPVAVRPRIPRAPIDPWTARYLESLPAVSHSMVSGDTEKASVRHLEDQLPSALASLRLREDTLQALGGRANSDQDGIMLPSASYTHTHFSDISPDSPKLLWIPANRPSETQSHVQVRDTGAKSDITEFSMADSMVSRAYNTSSVLHWDAIPPKPSVPQAKKQAHEKSITHKVKPALPNDARGSSKHNKDIATYRPTLPKTRSASGSRGRAETPGSALGSNTDLAVIAQKHGGIAQRVQSAQGRHTPEHGRGGSYQTPEANQESPPSHQRSSSSLLRGRIVDRPPSRAAHSARPPNSLDNREVSRGRQPPRKRSVSRQTSGTPRRKSASRQRTSGSTEPVDLSQYQLIEEFTSPHCPMHGERSHSAAIEQAGHAPLKHRPRGISRRRNNKSVTGHSNTPPVLSRAQTSDPVLWHTQQPLQPLAVLPHDDSRSPPPRSRDLAWSPPPTMPFEPKTPVAMLLVSDGQPLAPAIDPSLKCIERTTKEAMEISRPKSVVW